MFQAVIVDDEPLILEGLLTAIDWEGFNIEIVYSSTNPSQVLDYVLNNPVHLVITDVSMPEMDGLTLTKLIKKSKPSVFVLILSAYNNFEYVRSALRYGAENYLLKPIDKDELSDSLSQIIGILQERAQLSSTYGRTVMTFRNTFTEQWLKNLLPNSDLVTKADLLGINLDVSEFTVVCFSCRSNNEAIMSRFFDFFLHYLPGHFTSLFHFETPLRLVGIISPTSQSEPEVEQFLVPILDNAARNDMPIFASIGPTVNSYTDVPLSYNCARSLTFLEYTKLSHAKANNCAVIKEAVQLVLDEYSPTNPPIEDIDSLYETFPADRLTNVFLSKRISSFCSNEHELADKFPEVTDLLRSYENTDHRNYVLNFLYNTQGTIDKMLQAYSPMIDVVIESIHSFSDKDISLKLLANRLNVSPAYLGTVFHQQTGYYFNDYLAEARLKYGAELLLTTNLKIKDIVEKCCFSSQTYFNRSFKRYFGTSPVSYRREKKICSMQESENA